MNDKQIVLEPSEEVIFISACVLAVISLLNRGLCKNLQKDRMPYLTPKAQITVHGIRRLSLEMTCAEFRWLQLVCFMGSR